MKVTITFQQEKDDIINGVPKEFVRQTKQDLADDVAEYFDQSEVGRRRPKKLSKTYESMVIESGAEEPRIPGLEK